MQLTSSNKPVLYQLLHSLGEGALGRRTLVEKTGISEMTTRTHLNKLRDAGWVKMAKAGTSLTPMAKRELAPYFETLVAIRELEFSDLTLYRANVGALLRNCADSFGNSLMLRDAAVRAGAAGALFLVKWRAGWMFSEEDELLANNFPNEAGELDRLFDAPTGDLLVIAFGPQISQARTGLWSVIAELVHIDFK